MLEEYTNNLVGVFGPPQLMLTHGEGCYVWDRDGNRYLDMYAGIAVNALGHNHPDLVKTLSLQASKLIHVSNFFTTPAQVHAASLVRRIVCQGRDNEARVFFSNSGTEANEAALKVVRLYQPKRTKVIAFTHAFHGRTFGTMSITYKERYRLPFMPLPFDAQFIEPTVEALDEAMSDDVAAVFVEPIQGEAGVLPVASDVAWHARELCTKHDALLVVDEVQTGVGRTGQWMGHHAFDDHRGVFQPDVVTLAKGLAGGVPIGAMVTVKPGLDKVFEPGLHGSTFGGNPLATACAATVVSTIDSNDLMTHVLGQGKKLRDWLEKEAPCVSFVRGRGMLIGVGLAEGCQAADFVARGRSVGLLLNNTDETTIRLAPPLIFGDDERHDFYERWLQLCKGRG